MSEDGITIEEAVKVLTFEQRYPGNLPVLELERARQLAFAALKRIEEIRPFGNNPGIYNLLGETE